MDWGAGGRMGEIVDIVPLGVRMGEIVDIVPLGKDGLGIFCTANGLCFGFDADRGSVSGWSSSTA